MDAFAVMMLKIGVPLIWASALVLVALILRAPLLAWAQGSRSFRRSIRRLTADAQALRQAVAPESSSETGGADGLGASVFQEWLNVDARIREASIASTTPLLRVAEGPILRRLEQTKDQALDRNKRLTHADVVRFRDAATACADVFELSGIPQTKAV